MALIHTARAQNVVWVNPPIPSVAGVYSSDQAWQIGSTQTLSWESSFPTAKLTLIQQSLTDHQDYIVIAEGILCLLLIAITKE